MLLFSVKSKNVLVFIILISFCISLTLALIHTTFSINPVSTILGLTLFISGVLHSIFLYLKNQNSVKSTPILMPIKQINSTPNNQRTVNTSSGNYNENIGRDFVGRDSINKNIKNINIGNREVEVNPNNIIVTFDEFRDILTQSITQSSDALEAISEFARQLTEELRKSPEVKVSFGVDENINEQELVNKIFIDLLTKTYNQISEVSQNYQIARITQPEQIEKINISNSSGFIERFESRGNNEYDISYREYTIYLFQEKRKRWLYRIIRRDLSVFVEHSKNWRNIYYAIGKAIDQIDNEIDMKWKNRINTPE